MNTDVTCGFIFGLPKAELHLHLRGILGPNLRLALTRESGVDIGQSMVRKVRATYRSNGPMPFLVVYYLATDALQDEDDFYDLVAACFERARANGVMRTECFFDPQAHTSRDIVIKTVIRGYHRAVVEVRKAGLSADLILCFLHDTSVQFALETLQTTLPYKDMFISVGLDSNEYGDPPMGFAEISVLVREADLYMTIRYNIDQVGSIDNIRAALIELGAERLDHGTNIVGDPEPVAYARGHDIDLTSYPPSNSFATEETRGKRIAEPTTVDVKANVSSNDPVYFGDYVGDNYLVLAQCFGLGYADLGRIARNSIEAAQTSDDEEAELLECVDCLMSKN